MLPLLLAVATTLAEPAPPPPFADYCDARKLQALLATNVKKLPLVESDLDIQIAATLAEERREQAALGQIEERTASVEREATRLRWLGLGLLVVAAAAMLLAARRRSTGLALAALGLLVLQAGGNSYAAHRTKDAEQERTAGSSRVLALTACRLRINETRALLHHSQLAHCIHDLDEADEDLIGWIGKLHSGQTVGLPEFEKLHGEIRDALK